MTNRNRIVRLRQLGNLAIDRIARVETTALMESTGWIGSGARETRTSILSLCRRL